MARTGISAWPKPHGYLTPPAASRRRIRRQATHRQSSYRSSISCNASGVSGTFMQSQCTTRLILHRKLRPQRGQVLVSCFAGTGSASRSIIIALLPRLLNLERTLWPRTKERLAADGSPSWSSCPIALDTTHWISRHSGSARTDHRFVQGGGGAQPVLHGYRMKAGGSPAWMDRTYQCPVTALTRSIAWIKAEHSLQDTASRIRHR